VLDQFTLFFARYHILT